MLVRLSLHVGILGPLTGESEPRWRFFEVEQIGTFVLSHPEDSRPESLSKIRESLGRYHGNEPIGVGNAHFDVHQVGQRIFP